MENELIEILKASGILFGILIIVYLLPKLLEALEWIDDKIYPVRYHSGGIPKFKNPPPPPRPNKKEPMVILGRKAFEEHSRKLAEWRRKI